VKQKIVGYVVVSTMGLHQASPPMEGEKPILWLGSPGTIFRDRQSAHQIIRRTTAYAKKHEHNWYWFETAKILPVRAL